MKNTTRTGGPRGTRPEPIRVLPGESAELLAERWAATHGGLVLPDHPALVLAAGQIYRLAVTGDKAQPQPRSAFWLAARPGARPVGAATPHDWTVLGADVPAWVAEQEAAGRWVEVIPVEAATPPAGAAAVRVADIEAQADWKAELTGLPLTTAAQQREAEAEAYRAERDAAEAAELAAQRERWRMLHGDVAEVDLNDVWHLLSEEQRTYGPQDVETLAEVAGGAAKRLAAGVASLQRRRDSNTCWHIRKERPGQVFITAWSTGGCWRPHRAWWVQAWVDVDVDEWHQVRVGTAFMPTTMVVAGAEGHTVFRDADGGPLASVVARAWMDWEARWGVRDQAGLPQPQVPDEALSLQGFLEAIAARRAGQ